MAHIHTQKIYTVSNTDTHTHTAFTTVCSHNFIHTSSSYTHTEQSPQGKARLSSLCSCSLITGPLTNSNYPHCPATTRFNQSDKVISLTLQATRKELFLFAPILRHPYIYTVYIYIFIFYFFQTSFCMKYLFLLSVFVHSLMVTTCI